jgi:hypothetical protein
MAGSSDDVLALRHHQTVPSVYCFSLVMPCCSLVARRVGARAADVAGEATPASAAPDLVVAEESPAGSTCAATSVAGHVGVS